MPLRMQRNDYGELPNQAWSNILRPTRMASLYAVRFGAFGIYQGV